MKDKSWGDPWGVVPGTFELVEKEDYKRLKSKQDFIRRFCNDHNGEIRWLRGVAFDYQDLLEQILGFFDSASNG